MFDIFCYYCIFFFLIIILFFFFFFFFSSRRRHTRCGRDWSSDVCSSDLNTPSFEPNRVSAPALGWEKLQKSFEEEVLPPSENILAGSAQNIPETDLYPEHYQYKQRYIVTSVKSGLMIIDQHKAHIRILFEK